ARLVDAKHSRRSMGLWPVQLPDRLCIRDGNPDAARPKDVVSMDDEGRPFLRQPQLSDVPLSLGSWNRGDRALSRKVSRRPLGVSHRVSRGQPDLLLALRLRGTPPPVMETYKPDPLAVRVGTGRRQLDPAGRRVLPGPAVWSSASQSTRVERGDIQARHVRLSRSQPTCEGGPAQARRDRPALANPLNGSGRRALRAHRAVVSPGEQGASLCGSSDVDQSDAWNRAGRWVSASQGT